jgi:4-amino-4-deoxy-L-arabinose transferase-like glycosyltransferase
MGQETGLTALAVVGLLLYLPRTRAEESTGLVVAAGLAAGLGTLAREYGLVLPLFGLALGFARKLSRRSLGIFGVTAALAALPWYARNWHRTGNPLFDLNLGGLFPTNPVHGLLADCFQRAFGWAHVPPEALQLLAINALVGLLGLAAGLVFLRRHAAGLLAAAGLVVAIWITSVGYTAAGYTYSLRVLSPALVLGAVLGGAVLARVIPGRRLLAGVTLGLTLIAVDAALRTLVLPANVYRVPPARWFATGRALHEYHERPIYAELVRRAGSSRLLVLGPNALLTRLGARTAPLWSPEVRFLFDPAISPPEIARQLRAAGFGFVLLNTGAVNECFLAHSLFFRDPAGMLTPVWSDGDMVLLSINDRAAP